LDAARWKLALASAIFHLADMPDPYQTLAEVLRERLAVIADRAAYQLDPSGHLVRLQKVSEQIIALRAALPSPVDPQLAHYLDRSSYDKALAFIEETLAKQTT
jgi:hypothetical protein